MSGPVSSANSLQTGIFTGKITGFRFHGRLKLQKTTALPQLVRLLPDYENREINSRIREFEGVNRVSFCANAICERSTRLQKPDAIHLSRLAPQLEEATLVRELRSTHEGDWSVPAPIVRIELVDVTNVDSDKRLSQRPWSRLHR